MRDRFFLFVLFLMIFFQGVPVSFSAEVSATGTPAFRNNEGKNSVAIPSGETFSFGAVGVSPDGNNGTTASAEHLASSTMMPLPSQSASGRPSLFGVDIPISTAITNGYLSPWRITLLNESDTYVRDTPNRASAEQMGFVRHLSIRGTGTSPTITWNLPISGGSVNRVSYELWNADTDQIISGPLPISIGANATSFNLSNLSLGANYALRIMPEHRDSTGLVARSSNWIDWVASNGQLQGSSAKLVTGSPVGITQLIDTPAGTFTLEFDYYFTTTSGFLQIFLDGKTIGTRIDAPSGISAVLNHAIFEIEDNEFFNLVSSPLLFQLDGPSGSIIYIDNVQVDGITNGDFDKGEMAWLASGPGNFEIADAPKALKGMSLSLQSAIMISTKNDK